jgi:DNA-binding NarL/FixJ family response regulator
MKKEVSPIKVILADDHELFREGFRVMLKKHLEIMVVAEAVNGEDLLQKVFKYHPDVVITDIKMPKVDGLEVMNQLKKHLPDISVIALTNFDDDTLIIDMLEAGAKGYLLKSANSSEIIEAIKTVQLNKSFYCSYITEKVAELIAKSSFNPFRKSKKVVFNDREISIIKYICEELTNKQIAEKLFLSKRTIETHRDHILDKMGVKNTAGVVIYAIKHGYFKA